MSVSSSRDRAHDGEIARALGIVRRVLADLPAGRARRLLIACSGGADSVTLVGLLDLLRRKQELELAIGHVDHGLRPESAREAEQVAALAERLGLPHRSTRVSLGRGSGLPARARAARREALLAQAHELDVGTIALGHTATDQAETMLMHMVRGAALDGLAAMPSHDPPWLRPLLRLTRAETRSLAGRLGLPFVDDPTNEDRGHLRVFLRMQVLAPLRERHPNLDRALVSLAEDARDAEEALDQWARREEAGRRRGLDPGPGSSWSLLDFHVLPRAVRTRALRHMCARTGVDLCELRRRTLDDLDAAALAVSLARHRRASVSPGDVPSPAPKHWDLAPQRRVTIDRNGVHGGPEPPPGDRPNH